MFSLGMTTSAEEPATPVTGVKLGWGSEESPPVNGRVPMLPGIALLLTWVTVFVVLAGGNLGIHLARPIVIIHVVGPRTWVLHCPHAFQETVDGNMMLVSTRVSWYA